MIERLMYVWDRTHIPSCHNITHKILTKFFSMRFKMYNSKQKKQFVAENKNCKYNSKTMAMHAII